MRNMTKTFGVFCLSSSIGLSLYWTMFLISNFLRVQRFGVEIPNINISTALIGAVSVALFAFGIMSFKSKSTNALALVRSANGSVGSIVTVEYASRVKKAEKSTFDFKSAIETPNLPRFLRHKRVLGIIALTATISGYFSVAFAMGTFTPVMAVSSISMRPAFDYGDLIIIRGTQPPNVEVGDIIAFNVPSPFDQLAGSPTVHRVVEKWTEDGKIYFRTKGDGNTNADQWKLPAENVVGKYAEIKIPYLGSAAIFFKSPLGIAVLGLSISAVLLYGYYKKKDEN